jgi:lipopolysaccharide biosynthesis glycosyltransferase
MIYLDVDALVLSDVACLHRVDLEGRMLAGCHDLYLEERVLVDREYAEYNEKALGLKPEQGYFNSGVLVFNLTEIRKYAPGIFMRGLFSVKKPRFHDQDILNSVCAGKVAFLPPGWNVLEWMADPGEESYLLQFGGRRVRDICREARRDMKVLHYAGTKPWSPAYFGDCGAQWWKYAERTPFHRRMREEMRLGDDISWLRRKRRHAWFQVWKAGLFRWFCAGARKRHWREKSHNAWTNFRRIQKRMDKAGCA